MTTAPRRPGLLSVGIILLGIKSALAVAAATCAGSLLAVVTGTAATQTRQPEEGLVLLGLGAVGGMVLAFLLLLQVITLLICWRAWSMSRPWLWALILVAGLGLLSGELFSLVTGVLAIVGAAQALQELGRTEPPASAEDSSPG